jgi:hypothetical protein
MTNGPDELTSVQICRARADLRAKVDHLLHGHRLDIRELARHLSIGNPANPDKGRIHIAYTTRHVSHRQVTWNFLGPLQGYETDDDPDREPGVTAATIITILTGHASPPRYRARWPKPRR